MSIDGKTIAVASTSALFGLFALCSPSVNAAPVFWDLAFLDEGDTEIGTGWFSYDDAAPFERDFYVLDEPVLDYGPEFSIDKSDNWFLIDGFFAQIQGETWEFNSLYSTYTSWIPPKGNTYLADGSDGGLANVLFSRSGEPSIGQYWLVGDERSLPFLTMWTLGGKTSFLQATLEDAAFGSWTATRRSDNSKNVPESPTTLAALLAVGGFARLKQRSNPSRSRNWQQK